MARGSEPLPNDIEALKAALSVERAQREEAVAHALGVAAELALARALASDQQAVSRTRNYTSPS